MLIKYKNHTPTLTTNNFIAQGAKVIGNTYLGNNVSIWYNAVIRGDNNLIYIDDNSNIQDNVTIHTDKTNKVHIGKNVSIGHNAVIHGCTINDNCLIGINSTILDGAIIGKNCLVGANSLITSNSIFEDNTLILGSPAKAIKKLTQKQIDNIYNNSITYIEHANYYLNNK